MAYRRENGYILGTMKKLKIFLIITIVSLAFTLQLVGANGIDEQLASSLFYYQPQTASSSQQRTDDISLNMRKLELLYRLVERDFLYEIDNNAVFESMAKGLFAALDDPYSGYVVAKEAADFTEETTGTYGGIGAYISKNFLEYRDFSKPDTYMVNITSVFPGSPAEMAGLRSGDLISHIDGKPVDDWEAEEASRALKGEPNTTVILTIHRGSTVFDVSVVRKIVTVPTVSKTYIDDTIGYLRITQFTNSTTEQAGKVIQEFANKNLKGIILDLRDNPGGVVDSAVSVADMFLSGKPIVHIYTKNDARKESYTARTSTLFSTSIPMIVLVNKGSASSSEILAGALKDNNRATLVGNTTYGKGLIQLVSPFDEGYYTLTTSQYRTPNGNDINKVGIPVDYDIEEIVVAEEDLDRYTEFVQSGIVETFVDEHPEYSEVAVQLFLSQVEAAEEPLPRDIYRLLLRREYLNRMPYEERPIVDPDYDPALKKAIDLLTTGR